MAAEQGEVGAVQQLTLLRVGHALERFGRVAAACTVARREHPPDARPVARSVVGHGVLQTAGGSGGGGMRWVRTSGDIWISPKQSWLTASRRSQLSAEYATVHSHGEYRERGAKRTSRPVQSGLNCSLSDASTRREHAA